MKYKIELLIMVSVLFCLLLAQAAPASYTAKSLYIDGQHVLDVNGGDSLDFPTGLIRIAAEGGDGYIYNEYVGAMDEFAVYAGLLSDARILAHYAAQDSNADYTAAVLYDNPLLWLRFQDAALGSGSVAENSGSSLTNGRYFINGSVGAFTLVQGINADSNALNIPDSGSGSAGHKVEVIDNGEFGKGLDGKVTVEVWVKYTSVSDYPRFYTTGSVGGYGLHINSGDPDANQWIIHGGGENYVELMPDINNGQWHQIVITYESVTTPRILPDTNSYEEEVSADNPVVWLRFNDAQPKDYSAADGNHWVGYGAGLSIVDKVGGIGKSAYLNGSSSSYAAATNNPNSPPVVGESYAVFGDQYAFAPNDITFEIWYKTLPAGQPQPAQFGYFFQQHGSYDSGVYDTNNEFIAPAAGNGGGQVRISGGSALGYTGINPKFDGEWHHIVVTYDEEYNDVSNQLRVELYIDGLFKDDTLFTTPVGSPYTARLGPELSHIMIGAENDMGNAYNTFVGYVDEFAIYAGILDPNRVLVHYSAWRPHNCAELMNKEPGLAGDIDHDCDVDFADFAGVALDWSLCNEPNKPGCSPNW